jgi:hypothetical protein
LSFAQEELWLLDRLLPGEVAYHVPIALRLTGQLDRAALQRALDRVVERHEALRTRFPAVDGLPVQEIEPAAGVDLEVLTRPPDAASQSWVAEQSAAATAQPFDLAAGPVARARLLAMGPAEHVLLLTLHHIVCDGPAIGLLLRDLAALYAAEQSGHQATLPPMPIQYADYALWQRQQADEGHFDVHLAWWRERLAGASTELDLPFDRPRTDLPSRRGAAHLHPVSEELWAEVSRLSRRYRTTPYTTFLAAAAVWLGRVARTDDLLIGSAVGGRDRQELEPLVGMLASMLPIRIRLAAADTFAALLGQVRGTVLGALSHQSAPLERLLDRAGRDPTRHPLIQVTFALESEPPAPPVMPGLETELAEPPTLTSKFDLAVTVSGYRQGAVPARQLWLVYRTDLFDPATVAGLAAGYTQLLGDLVAAPDAPLRRWLGGGAAGRADEAAPTAAQAVPAGSTRSETARPAARNRALTRWLSAEWCAVLGVDSVSTTDNFFDLGGSSRLLAQVHARLVAHLGIDLQLITLYQYPTIAAMVRRLSDPASEPRLEER